MSEVNSFKNAITEAMANLGPNEHLLFLDCDGTEAGLVGFEVHGAAIEFNYRYDMSKPESKYSTQADISECSLKASGISGSDIDDEPFHLYFKKLYD